MQACERRHDRSFLMPEIETIEDLVENHCVLVDRPGSSGTCGMEYFWFLKGRWLDVVADELTGKGYWGKVYIAPGRNRSRAIYPHMSEGKIGGFEVVKGSWPDPYALLLVKDTRAITQRWLSLINYEDYQSWLNVQFREAERMVSDGR